MINMETIIKARRLHYQGLSVRQIAKQLLTPLSPPDDVVV